MRSHNPAYGLWNDGEDEVKSSKKYGARALDKSVEEAGYAACAYEITKEWNGESDDSNRENIVRAN